MAKKCIICDKEASFCIKGSSECYCPECAEEHFGDVNYLQKIDTEAKLLKTYVDAKVKDD